MNRAQRRLYNKQHKTNYNRHDFNLFEAMGRIRQGNYNLSDLDLGAEIMHADNQILAPDGTKCRLNLEGIMTRPKENTTPEFRDWVTRHRDDIFTITREGVERSLVALEEDVCEVPNYDENGNKLPYVRYLWDLYTDLLIYDSATDSYKPLFELEEGMKEHLTQTVSEIMAENGEKLPPEIEGNTNSEPININNEVQGE